MSAHGGYRLGAIVRIAELAERAATRRLTAALAHVARLEREANGLGERARSLAALRDAGREQHATTAHDGARVTARTARLGDAAVAACAAEAIVRAESEIAREAADDARRVLRCAARDAGVQRTYRDAMLARLSRAERARGERRSSELALETWAAAREKHGR